MAKQSLAVKAKVVVLYLVSHSDPWLHITVIWTFRLNLLISVRLKKLYILTSIMEI